MPYDAQQGWNQTLQTATAASGMYMTQKNNKKSRQFALEMYGRQRQDALDDWNRNNLYNSPQEQMARLKEAGLNPNLIYGKGAGDLTSAPIRSTDAQSWKPETPDVRPMQAALMSGYDMRMKSAQTDLLAKQMEVMQADIQLKGAQAYSTLTGVDRTKIGIHKDAFDLARTKALFPFDLQAAEIGIGKKQADLDYTRAENIRRELSNNQSIAESVSRILTQELGRELTREQIDLLKKDQIIKDLDVKFANSNTRPTDPWYVKQVGLVIDRLMKYFFEDKPPREVSPQEKRELQGKTGPKN